MMSTEEGSGAGAGAALEDGEIEDSDVEDGTYIPLERPDNFNPPSLVNMQIQDEQSDSPDESSESSGSDSDEGLRPPKVKKSKVKPKPMPVPEPQQKKKYNIWCTALQEQLTEDMVGCDVAKTRKYGVESYDYTIRYRVGDDYIPWRKSGDTCGAEPAGNKRTHADRKNVKTRLGKRENHQHKKNSQHEARVLGELAVSENDPVDDVASDIADKLNEDKKDLIVRIVEVLGAAKAIELYQETKRVEEDGGILVMNGYRRRTPGGVYIFTLKRDPAVTTEETGRIFQEERRDAKRARQRAQAAYRDEKVQQLKQTLADSELPALLSRSEVTLVHSSEHGSNPPPSPATDARDGSSDTDAHSHTDGHPDAAELLDVPAESHRESRSKVVAAYDDDDFLEVNISDEMDMF